MGKDKMVKKKVEEYWKIKKINGSMKVIFRMTNKKEKGEFYGTTVECIQVILKKISFMDKGNSYGLINKNM